MILARIKDGEGLESKYWWSQYWALIEILEELIPDSMEERRRCLEKNLYDSEEWKRRDRLRVSARNRRPRVEPRKRASETDRMFEARWQTWLDRRDRDAQRKQKGRSERTEEQRRKDSEASKVRVARMRERRKIASDSSASERLPPQVLEVPRVDGEGRVVRPGALRADAGSPLQSEGSPGVRGRADGRRGPAHDGYLVDPDEWSAPPG